MTTNLIALNPIEESVLRMIESGKELHGMAREIAIEMALRAQG